MYEVPFGYGWLCLGYFLREIKEIASILQNLNVIRKPVILESHVIHFSKQLFLYLLYTFEVMVKNVPLAVLFFLTFIIRKENNCLRIYGCTFF